MPYHPDRIAAIMGRKDGSSVFVINQISLERQLHRKGGFNQPQVPFGYEDIPQIVSGGDDHVRQARDHGAPERVEPEEVEAAGEGGAHRGGDHEGDRGGGPQSPNREEAWHRSQKAPGCQEESRIHSIAKGKGKYYQYLDDSNHQLS